MIVVFSAFIMHLQTFVWCSSDCRNLKYFIKKWVAEDKWQLCFLQALNSIMEKIKLKCFTNLRERKRNDDIVANIYMGNIIQKLLKFLVKWK